MQCTDTVEIVDDSMESVCDNGEKVAEIRHLSTEIDEFMPSLESAAKAAQALIDSDEASAHGRKPLPGHEAKARQLQEAIEQGNVEARGPLGQQFRAYLASSKKAQDEYNNALAVGPGQKNQKKKRVST